jgi:hypothetical protein
MRITSVQFHGKNAGTGILFPQYKQTLARTNVPMFPFPRGNIPWLLKLRLRSDSVQHTATHCCCPVPAGNDRRIIISWRRAGAEPRGTNRRHQHQQRKRPSHQPHELYGCSAARGGLTDDDPSPGSSTPSIGHRRPINKVARPCAENSSLPIKGEEEKDAHTIVAPRAAVVIVYYLVAGSAMYVYMLHMVRCAGAARLYLVFRHNMFF